MSKKYVPSFLKDSQPSIPSDLSSSAPAPALVSQRTNDFPDAFQMKKPKREVTRESNDAFPMNRKKHVDFDAFNKAAPLPEMDAFSKKVSHASSDFDAFSRKPKQDDFPMSKGGRGPKDGIEDFDPFRSKKQKENRTRSTAPPVISTATFAPGTLASLTARKPGEMAPGDGEETGNSFAAKFAQRMKIMEDPDYVPPPAIVNVSSEEEFPTLGFAPVVVSKRTTTTWNLPSSALLVTEEVCTIVTEEKENLPVDYGNVPARKEKSKKSNKEKKIPILRRKATTTIVQEEGEFKPIEYDDDAFEEEEWNQSDMDEEEFFRDSGEEDDEEDELNPNVYDDRRHREELY
jgi:hypothetical protein